MFNVSYKNKTTNVVVNDLNSAIDFAIGVSNNISGIKAVAITKDEDAQTAEVIMYDSKFVFINEPLMSNNGTCNFVTNEFINQTNKRVTSHRKVCR